MKSPRRRPLKIWNGRATGLGIYDFDVHAYLAAYSRADARRVCVEAGFCDPGESEIRVYFHAGCWGESMNGIVPERGVWLKKGWRGKPFRVSPGKGRAALLEDQPADQPSSPAPEPGA